MPPARPWSTPPTWAAARTTRATASRWTRPATPTLLARPTQTTSPPPPRPTPPAPAATPSPSKPTRPPPARPYPSTPSLHDALPICLRDQAERRRLGPGLLHLPGRRRIRCGPGHRGGLGRQRLRYWLCQLDQLSHHLSAPAQRRRRRRLRGQNQHAA